jgi:hypothetical protein
LPAAQALRVVLLRLADEDALAGLKRFQRLQLALIQRPLACRDGMAVRLPPPARGGTAVELSAALITPLSRS